MDNIQPITSSAGIDGTPLQLRTDDVITTAFVLKVVFVLAILLALVTAALRWISKRSPSSKFILKNLNGGGISVVSSAKISVKTKVSLIVIDGYKAVVVETPQGSELTWLPVEQQKNEVLKEE